MKKTLEEIKEITGGKLSGDGTIIITGAGDIDTAQEGQISFVKDKSFTERAKKSRASAIIVPVGFESLDKPVLESENPYVAFTKILNIIFKENFNFYKGIHKTAIIGENVKLGRVGKCCLCARQTRSASRKVTEPSR